MVKHKHFYENESVRATASYYLGLRKRRLFELLHKLMLTFEGYIKINNYAIGRGCKIINCTPGSFIDAFERIKLKE